MNLQTYSFTTLVQNMAASVQGASKYLLDLTVGSILRVVLEANASVVLWLQALILQVLATTRAATSSGSDLDSFMADYGLTRTAAVSAGGLVTFSRFTATLQALIPVGATVQTADGTQQFSVIANTALPSYSTAQGGYVLAAGASSLSVSAQAATAGAAGNVAAGQINTLTSAISGVDTVANSAAMTGGSDAESDAALRVRFVNFIASLSKATRGAIGFAITSLQPGMTYTLVENLQYGGAAQVGYFYAVVDDGSGSPPSGLLLTVYNAIDAVRPVGSTFGVFAPTVVTASVGMTITSDPAYGHSSVVVLVVAALNAYINSLPLGASLTYSRLVQIAYDASPGVTNVGSVLLNGATADLAATGQQVIKSGAIAIA